MPRVAVDWFRYVAGKRKAFLEQGVTSIRSMGDDVPWIFDLRRKIAAGDLEGPRVFAAGPIFTAPGGHPVATIGAAPDSAFVRVPASAEEVRRMVRELATGAERADTAPPRAGLCAIS